MKINRWIFVLPTAIVEMRECPRVRVEGQGGAVKRKMEKKEEKQQQTIINKIIPKCIYARHF